MTSLPLTGRFFDIVRNWGIADFEHAFSKYSGQSRGLPHMVFQYGILPLDPGEYLKCDCEYIQPIEGEDTLQYMRRAFDGRPLDRYNFLDERLSGDDAALVNEVVHKFRALYADKVKISDGDNQAVNRFGISDTLMYIYGVMIKIADGAGIPSAGKCAVREVFTSPLIRYILYFPTRGIYPALVLMPQGFFNLQFPNCNAPHLASGF